MDQINGIAATLEAGDVFVLTPDQPMTIDHAKRLHEYVSAALPEGVRVLVLDPGYHFEVLPRPIMVSRVADNDRALMISFRGVPSDDALRGLLDVLRGNVPRRDDEVGKAEPFGESPIGTHRAVLGDIYGFRFGPFGDGTVCKHDRATRMETGDGTPIDFCPDCGVNMIADLPGAPIAGDPNDAEAQAFAGGLAVGMNWKDMFGLEAIAAYANDLRGMDLTKIAAAIRETEDKIAHEEPWLEALVARQRQLQRACEAPLTYHVTDEGEPWAIYREGEWPAECITRQDVINAMDSYGGGESDDWAKHNPELPEVTVFHITGERPELPAMKTRRKPGGPLADDEDDLPLDELGVWFCEPDAPGAYPVTGLKLNGG